MKNKLSIEKVAVIGSGIMGSRIACHMANIGLDVLLLDIAPFKLNESEEKGGLTLEHPKVKKPDCARCAQSNSQIKASFAI